MEVGSAPPPASSPPVHPAVAPLSYLLGRWKGEGEGGYPTINSFKYGEELLFSHSGKPVIAYSQKTWKLASGEPMHAESGYWRPKPDGSIEVVIAQSTGLVEVQKGSYDAEKKIVMLRSELVGNASKLKVTFINHELHIPWNPSISLTVIGDDSTRFAAYALLKCHLLQLIHHRGQSYLWHLCPYMMYECWLLDHDHGPIEVIHARRQFSSTRSCLPLITIASTGD